MIHSLSIAFAFLELQMNYLVYTSPTYRWSTWMQYLIPPGKTDDPFSLNSFIPQLTDIILPWIIDKFIPCNNYPSFAGSIYWWSTFNALAYCLFWTLRLRQKNRSKNIVCWYCLLQINGFVKDSYRHTDKQCGPRSDCSWSVSTLFATKIF